MAQIREVRLVDDLDGGAADENITFAIDGKSYEIDLSTKNGKKLRDDLAPYIGAARRASSSTRSTGTRSATSANANRSVTSLDERRENGNIREWARSQGMKVSDRGRIPADVLDAYRDRNNRPADNIRPADSSGHSRDECDNLDECPTHGETEAPAASEVPAAAFDDGTQTDETPAEETAPRKPAEPTTVDEFNGLVIAWHDEQGVSYKTKKDGSPTKAMEDRYLKAQQQSA